MQPKKQPVPCDTGCKNHISVHFLIIERPSSRPLSLSRSQRLHALDRIGTGCVSVPLDPDRHMNGVALIRCKRQPLARVVRIIRIVQRNPSFVGPAALRPGRDGDLDPLICHAVQIDLHAPALFRKPVILRAALGKDVPFPNLVSRQSGRT